MWLELTLFAVAVVLIWYSGRLHKRVLSNRVHRALQSGLSGRIIPTRGPNASGLSGTVEPPPDPFRTMEITYSAFSLTDPLDVLFRQSHIHRNSLILRGHLIRPPKSELVWRRGQHPGIALGNQPGEWEWTFSSLDFAHVDFAVRGTNAPAITHAFVDMVTRNGRHIRSLYVRQDSNPAVELVVEAAHLTINDAPSLIASLVTIARAATRA